MDYTTAATAFAVLAATTAFVPRDQHRVEPLTSRTLHGDIDVSSFGIAELSGDRGPPIPALHVREIITNRTDDMPWTLELAASTVAFGDARPAVHPMLVNADENTLPLLIVLRGQRRVVDLYFPAPPDVASDDLLASFAFTYRVNTPDHHYEAHAMFARAGRWPKPAERAPEPSWGHRWWADPTYPWHQYFHRPGFLVPRPPTRVDVVHVPRSFYLEVPRFTVDVTDAPWPDVTECDQW